MGMRLHKSGLFAIPSNGIHPVYKDLNHPLGRVCEPPDQQ